MKKPLLHLLFCCFVVYGAAQEKVAALSFDYKNPGLGKKYSSAWLQHVDNSNQFLLSVVQKDEVLHFLINDSMKVVSSFSEEREKLGEFVDAYFFPKVLARKNIFYNRQFARLECVHWSEQRYMSLFVGIKTRYYFFHLVDFGTHSSKFVSSWIPEENEKVIGHYQTGSEIHWITLAGKKKKELRFYQFGNDEKITTTRFDIAMLGPGIGDMKTNDLTDNMALIAPGHYPDNYSASRKIKIYPGAGNTCITFDGKSPVTHIFFIEKNNLISAESVLHDIGTMPSGQIKNSSSFKNNDILFLLSTSVEDLFFTVYDLQQKTIKIGASINVNQMKEKNEQGQAVTPKTKNLSLFDLLLGIKRQPGFFEILAEKDQFIKARQEGDDYELNFGACSPLELSGEIAGGGTTARVVLDKGQFITSGLPPHLFEAIGTDFTYVFSTVKINRQTFEGVASSDLSDEINKPERMGYKIAGVREPEAIAICKWKNIFYLGYYTGATGEYLIHKF